MVGEGSEIVITLAAARRMIAAAELKAGELNVTVVIAVADASGHLVAMERMDGAKFVCVDIACAKAFTAAAFGESTLGFGERAQPGTELFGINAFGKPGIAIFGGGVPVVDESGNVVGGIGVSGSPTETDCLCAEAAAGAFRA